MGPKTGSEIVSARKIPNGFQEAIRFTLDKSRVEWKKLEKTLELLSVRMRFNFFPKYISS